MKNMKIAVLGAMLFTIVSVGASSLSASPVSKLEMEKYFTVDSVQLFEVVDGKDMFVDSQPLVAVEPAPAPSDAPKAPAPKVPGDVKIPTDGSIDIGTIINLGKEIWAIIEKNKPVVTQSYTPVSAMPAGVTSWMEMEGWQEPSVRLYKLVYKNLYGQKVVEFNYRVAYTYGGSYNGAGKYLARVEVEPALLNVLWGYKFNANGQVLNITNRGTKASPVAAMELQLNWQINTVMKHSQASVRYSIAGDGAFQNTSEGNEPSELK